ncbi:MAG TPA: HAMP domain-containing sensor histidine kinase, partial [Cyclobacteriaceae bacterium]|nr:HAMP domain-containing sensor histidine kinase [Cyclobacteriaceae bacterium]
ADYALGKSYSYQALGQLYLTTKEYEKAEKYMNIGEAYSKKINYYDVLARIYKNKSDLWRIKHDYQKALLFSDKYATLKDSVLNKNVGNRILSLQYDFELDKKDEEIKILNQQGQLQQSKLELQQIEIRQQRFIIVIGLIIFISICLWAYFIFRYYRKVKKLNREISEQNEEIISQSEELIEANQALGKMNREISEQKEEIQAQAEELTESNQTIARVNLSLEEKVKIRTAELKEAYNELDTFFYRSSHDFRRPLTTFMGLAEVAKVTLKDPSALELFEKVNETARNLDKMLVKLQSVSAVGTQELIYTEILLDQILQIELDNFHEEIIRRSIKVLTEIKLKQPFISYPVLIKFIIQNLLENSIAFCGVESPFIKFRAYQVANETVLEVSDNGQGIESTYLNRIFEMYFRANERSRGNGLGLYIVKKMVDKLNGRIELKTELGIGTTVWVYLPNHLP